MSRWGQSHRVAAGGTVMDPEMASRLVAKRACDEPPGRLAPREREVLALMAEGTSNAVVATSAGQWPSWRTSAPEGP